jgi:hypothetical protein
MPRKASGDKFSHRTGTRKSSVADRLLVTGPLTSFPFNGLSRGKLPVYVWP